MDSDARLIFRGRAHQGEQKESSIIIYPDAVGESPGESPTSEKAAPEPLEISGAHARAAALALQLARQPVSFAALQSTLAQRAEIEPALAGELLENLARHRVLCWVVPAVERFAVYGDDVFAEALRSHVERTVVPKELGRLTIAPLGTLGTLRWRERFALARELTGPVLSCSLEAGGGWIGPVFGTPQGPCPACLVARRVAAHPSVGLHASILEHNPRSIGLLCESALLWAIRWARGEIPEDEVLHVTEDAVARRQLLPQPACRYCDGKSQSNAALSSAAAAVVAGFEQQWRSSEDLPEPGDRSRRAFLDDALGPISIEEYGAPGLYRGLPLVLGSLRFMQPVDQGLERRELFSVTFGTGMTEARRRLVAFAEGVERYAGIIEPPDVEAKPFAELAPFAFPPEETIRFAGDQYTDAPGAPSRYRGQRTDWSWVYEWTRGEPKLLIHDAVAFSQVRKPETFRLFEDPFSSGAAAHRSLPQALERALLELIERDAFVLAWYLQLPLPELVLDRDLNPEAWDMRSYLARHGIELKFFDLRVDFDVPCVLTVARTSQDHGPWRAGGVILSASAGTSWEQATCHGIHEILGHFSVFGIVSPEGDKSIDPATGKVRPWWPMFAAYLEPRSDAPLSFLGGGTSTPFARDPSEPVPLADRLENLRRQFLSRALPVFVRRLGRRDVEASGLTAVRACVPGLLRMTQSRETVNFGEPRIEGVRRRWRARDGLNPCPTHSHDEPFRPLGLELRSADPALARAAAPASASRVSPRRRAGARRHRDRPPSRHQQ